MASRNLSRLIAAFAAALLIMGVFVAAMYAGHPNPARVVVSSRYVTASAVRYGVRLTMRMPNRPYPRNAVLNVPVRVRNMSNHLISAEGTSCTQTNPFVDSLGPHGTVLYPSSIRWFSLLPPCGATTEDTFMPPGYDAVYHVIVVAMGPLLRASMWLRPSDHTTQVTAAYPPLRLRLVPGTAPRVKILHRRQGLAARIIVPGHGPPALEYVTLAHCYPGSAPYDYLGHFWTATTSPVIRADCPHPASWRLLVGAIGGAAAFVSVGRS